MQLALVFGAFLAFTVFKNDVLPHSVFGAHQATVLPAPFAEPLPDPTRLALAAGSEVVASALGRSAAAWRHHPRHRPSFSRRRNGPLCLCATMRTHHTVSCVIPHRAFRALVQIACPFPPNVACTHPGSGFARIQIAGERSSAIAYERSHECADTNSLGELRDGGGIRVVPYHKVCSARAYPRRPRPTPSASAARRIKRPTVRPNVAPAGGCLLC